MEYINDLEDKIRSNVKFSADDAMLYCVVDDPGRSKKDLNHELDIINQFSHPWEMEFNQDATKQAHEVLFSYKKDTLPTPNLSLMEWSCSNK